ncbi:Fpg/Nei family DNA glycosylase [soil metagenome]
MPELPDLAVIASAFDQALGGRSLRSVTNNEPLVMRGTPTELAALVGQRLHAVTRRGKFLTLAFEDGSVIINPMLTGRLGLTILPAKQAAPKTALVMRFGPREEGAPIVGNVADHWPGGAPWLPHEVDQVEIRYRDTTRMGKVYVVPPGVRRPVAGWDEQGPDADDPDLDLESWRRRIKAHRGELKALLRNQAFVAGIGNAYADEILWQARLAPFRARPALATDEVDRLYESTRTVLSWAVAELRQRVPPRFETEVRDFLRVHRRGGEPCPRCGTAISEIAPGGFVTSFCRACQA